MRPDPARPSSSFGRFGGRVACLVRVIALVVGLTGCNSNSSGISLSELCLKERPGDIRCCFSPGWHVDDGRCCPRGYHALTDVEREDWKICVPDEDPCADAGACLDAGSDAGADAP
jgi:hypothetical protein